MSRDARELAISALARAMVWCGRRRYRRLASLLWRPFRWLILGRSSKQVERMERRMGLR